MTKITQGILEELLKNGERKLRRIKQILRYVSMSTLSILWPIYIDPNPRGFDTFCTKNMGFSGSQKPRGFGISAVLLPDSFQKLFEISHCGPSG